MTSHTESQFRVFVIAADLRFDIISPDDVDSACLNAFTFSFKSTKNSVQKEIKN